MFNKDFYPTPPELLDRLGIDCYNKIVLEPHAGKGNIVDWAKQNGAARVLGCELNPDLFLIATSKCQMIARDFLKVTAEQISHVQQIIMNPPFSCDEKHILHAWEIAPEGCEIYALCNTETVFNMSHYDTKARREIKTILDNYGDKEDLGDAFSEAERKTGTQVAFIKLFKPTTSEEFNYEGFYLEEETERQDNSVMSYNEIRAIVNAYIGSIKCWDKFAVVSSEMNRLTNVYGHRGGFTFTIGYDKQVVKKDEFARAMQKQCWKYIFDKMNIKKYVTKGVMEDINKFVETRQKYPFTMRNVYKMLEIIVGTRGNIMNRAIEEAVDKFTKHTHVNRFMVEGWKTNDGHMLNKKFITGWIAEPSYTSGLNIKHSNGNFEYLTDLTKALCYLTGKNFDDIPCIDAASPNGRTFEPNTWYKWGFFEFKVFKKGSGHFKFKSDKEWELLNKTYAKIKGQLLPETL